MKQSCISEIFCSFTAPPQSLGQHHRILAYTGGMSLSIGVLCIYRIGKGMDGLEGHLLYPPCPLLSDSRLLCDLFVKTVRITYLEKNALMITVHDKDHQKPVEEIEQRKTAHLYSCIMACHEVSQRGVE